jgi:hypothetical protein
MYLEMLCKNFFLAGNDHDLAGVDGIAPSDISGTKFYHSES